MRRVHKNRIRRRFVVGLLSLAVAVSTAAALMIPAMTMESEPQKETLTIITENKPQETVQAEALERGENVDAVPSPMTEEAETEAVADELPKEAPETVVLPMMGVQATALDSSSWSTNSATISAKVTLNNAQLEAGEFYFELLDADTEEVLQTASNDTDGDIVFDPISYDAEESGIYTYKIREVKGSNPNIDYDKNVYTVSIGVEKGASAPQTLEEKYYGVKTTNPYGWNMSAAMGGTDYFVYCIDATKPSPDTVATANPYWIAELEPDNEMLVAAVCHAEATLESGWTVYGYDGWLDDPSLKENLEKILYTITYGSLKSLDSSYKNALVWWATSSRYLVSDNLAYGSTHYKNLYSYMTTCLKTSVPSGYDLVLFHASDGESQPFVTLLESSVTNVFQSEEVNFTNTYNEPQQEKTSVTITASKTLNGKPPGANFIFSFELLDAGSNVLQTKQNDAEGMVTFDALTYTEAGTYTYTVREVNDHQSGIAYDTAPQTITVVVTKTASGTATDFDFTASSYYGLTSDDADDSKIYYLSKTKGGTDLAAFCVDASKNFPPLAFDLTSGYDLTKYSVVQNPSNTTLEGYVEQIKDSGNTAENLRKLLYYIDQHPGLSRQKQNALVWTATSAADEFYESVSQSELDAIYANTTVPSNYHLALFYPSQLGGTRTGVSLDNYQPLLAGYYTAGSSLSAEITNQQNCVFDNRTGYELPATGGIGTPPVAFLGLLCMAGAVVMDIIRNKRNNQRYT